MTDDQEMYQNLKRLWMSQQFEDEYEREEADLKYEKFIDHLIQLNADESEEVERDEPRKSQLLLEIFAELDEALTILPPRVRRYRSLLVAEGLDEAPGEEGKGVSVPGMSLADQATLTFHSNVLGLALNLAQELVLEKHRKEQ